MSLKKTQPVTLLICILFVFGVILNCILTPVVRYFGLRKGFLDCPQRARKVQIQTTPRLGGAAILISFIIVMFFSGVFVHQVREMLCGNNPILGFILYGSLGTFAVGFMGDLARFAPKT